MKRQNWTATLLALTLFLPAVAQQPRNDWENPAVFQINREAARADFLPYADVHSAIADEYHRSPWYLPLSGTWKFNWAPAPPLGRYTGSLQLGIERLRNPHLYQRSLSIPQKPSLYPSPR